MVTMRTGLITLVTMAATLSTGAEPPLAPRDFAPPKYHSKPADLELPKAKKHPRVTEYNKPATLDKKAGTSDWPCFLGPSKNGTSPETGLCDKARLIWTLDKGESYSAPSIVERKLVFFHRLEDDEIIECLDAENGGLYWTHTYPTRYRDRFRYLNGPRSSPAIIGGKVYTLGVEGVLTCLDLETGHLYWQRKLAAEYGIDLEFFGFSTSPLIEGDMVILNLGGHRAACVAAFDRNNGKLRWLSGRKWGRSYATPVAATMHGKRILFVFAGGMSNPPIGGLLGLDPNKGTIHFRFPFRSPRYLSANASTPVVSGSRVFISTSYDINGAMIEVQDDLTHKVAYKTDAFGSHWMTPILQDGHLYGLKNDILVCMEWKTGKCVWKNRLRLPGNGNKPESQPAVKRGGDQYREPPGETGFGFASMILADGRFICLSETGLLAHLNLSPKGCKFISWQRLFTAKQTWTAPVLSRGLLYVAQNMPDRKTNKPPRLLCLDLRKSGE